MLLALLAKPDDTNYDALALAPTIGWLLLACAICAVVMFTMHGDKWRRWAFEICAVLFLVGFRTRLFGVLTWFLMNSILVRNALPWEGTENVFRVMLTYLVLARSGHAYSVDNWLRCRKLRKQGKLSERDGPGGGAGLAPNTAHPGGLEPIYRLIPSWPRKLIMLQLAVIYLVTGTLKNGGVWMHGDALYYAINLDHFYRLPPQYLASLAGTTVFRGMTWAVKVGQMGFAVIIFGLVARWVIAQKFAPLSPVKQWISRLAFAGMIATTAAIIYVAYGVHHTPKIPVQAFTAGWVALWIGLWLVWLRLGHRPLVIRRLFGRTLAQPAVIDRVWVCKWLFGRRILLVWHLAFHMHIFTLMNVGQFQTGMMACTFAFLEGREIASLLRDIGHRLTKLIPPLARVMPRHVVERGPITPSADPNLPSHRYDQAGLPDWAVLLALAVVVASVLVRVYVEPSWDFRWLWLANAAMLIAIAAWRASTAPRREAAPHGRAPWSYGPMGRVLVGGWLVFHLFAVATWLMPDKDCLGSFRKDAAKSVGHYLAVTTTAQGWGMFAPNPPRRNVFMKVLVVDQSGEVWDLRTDVYAEERKPIPWIWNTRLRKMNRRIIGGESGPEWYRKWYARYECRAWAREHGGDAPLEVRLVRVSYDIPSPKQMREQGYYIAEERLEALGKEELVHTTRCASEQMGQLPNELRERHGLPLLDESVYKPWHKHKRKKWDERERE